VAPPSSGLINSRVPVFYSKHILHEEFDFHQLDPTSKSDREFIFFNSWTPHQDFMIQVIRNQRSVIKSTLAPLPNKFSKAPLMSDIFHRHYEPISPNRQNSSKVAAIASLLSPAGPEPDNWLVAGAKCLFYLLLPDYERRIWVAESAHQPNMCGSISLISVLAFWNVKTKFTVILSPRHKHRNSWLIKMQPIEFFSNFFNHPYCPSELAIAATLDTLVATIGLAGE